MLQSPGSPLPLCEFPIDACVKLGDRAIAWPPTAAAGIHRWGVIAGSAPWRLFWRERKAAHRGAQVDQAPHRSPDRHQRDDRRGHRVPNEHRRLGARSTPLTRRRLLVWLDCSSALRDPGQSGSVAVLDRP
jgi:hypothetical protein